MKCAAATSLLIGLMAATVCGQASFGPSIGYVYPAGGQRGTTVEVMVGGQYLRNTTGVFVSGSGVRAEVVHFYRPLFNIDKEQREALRKRMRELFQLRLGEYNPSEEPGRPRIGVGRRGNTVKASASQASDNLPEHPLLRDLDNMSLHELDHIRSELTVLRKRRQLSRQLAETVLVRLTIAANAEPGDRELRLLTGQGLSNPMRLQIGELPEVGELEPNDPQELEPLPIRVPDPPPLEPPVLVNGRINPGDVDRHRFQASEGQKLVIQVRARHLVPYLADAVPGWFQATMALYDADGRQVGSADDYRFDPDPVMLFDVPADGEYTVEIRDSIYRGREDFVYRLSIGEQPFVTEVFPLGGRGGSRTIASLEGWNLPDEQLVLATPTGPARVRETSGRQRTRLANSITYAVGVLPECDEAEPNNAVNAAQAIETPRIVNGRIDTPGDVDIYAFQGGKGDRLVAEVLARRLRSPMDSLLRLTDATGGVIAFNDDHEDPDAGLLTHHADSYLTATLPEDGTYFLKVADAQHGGSGTHVYRLRVGPPQPDYAVRITPSSLSIRPGGAATVCVHVLRKDGFDGPIAIELDDAPPGFVLHGNVVPESLDRVRMTVTAPDKPLKTPVALKFKAESRLRGYALRREVVPADDVMQAFAYRHLVPAQTLLAATIKTGRTVPRLEIDTNPGDGKRARSTSAGVTSDDASIRLPVGGTARINVRTPRPGVLHAITFALSDPPAGVSLAETRVTTDGMIMTLACDGKTAKPGRDNLIVEAFVKPPAKNDDKSKRQTPRQVLMGVLPAIPMEVVQP